MANKKFSQFETKTDPSEVDFLVGYTALENVKISTDDLLPEIIEPKSIVAGTFHNLFGGDPGIFGDTLEFGIQALPLSDSSSVLSVPFNCKIVGASIKWISDVGAVITAGNSWQVKLYKMNDNNGKTTLAGNYDFVGDFAGLLLDSSDNGGFPFKTSTTEFVLTAGDIINVSGVETGSILSSDAEMEMTIVIQPI